MEPTPEIIQPAPGYRYSLDALVLAWQVRPLYGAHLVDIGTGCGVIPVILARRYPSLLLTGIEVQKELACCARRNVQAYRLEGRIRIEEQDIRRLHPRQQASADLVVCNPPHIRGSAGRASPNRQRAVARQEIRMNLHDLLHAADQMLKPGGRLLAIYPKERMQEVLANLQPAGFSCARRRMVIFREGAPPRRFVIEAVKSMPAEEESLPPLVICSADGRYTPEALAVFEFAGHPGAGSAFSSGGFAAAPEFPFDTNQPDP